MRTYALLIRYRYQNGRQNATTAFLTPCFMAWNNFPRRHYCIFSLSSFAVSVPPLNSVIFFSLFLFFLHLSLLPFLPQTAVSQRFFGQVRVDRSTSPSPTFRLFSAERPADCMLAARCLDAVGEYVMCTHADQISLASPHYVGAVRYVLADANLCDLGFLS
jgi:hypothetical protein